MVEMFKVQLQKVQNAEKNLRNQFIVLIIDSVITWISSIFFFLSFVLFFGGRVVPKEIHMTLGEYMKF